MKVGDAENKNFEVFKEVWYREALLTIHNLTDIAVVLLNLGKVELLATVTELMQVEIQSITDEYCRKESEDAK